MARTRFDERLAPDRAEALLAAAGEEFAERGYAGASMSRIASAAGVSKGSLYYYFEDKADLLATAMERAFDRLLAESGLGGDRDAFRAWLEELEAEAFWDALRDGARRSVPLIRSDAWYVRLARAFHRLRDEPEVGEAAERVMERGRSMIRELLSRGRELGLVRTDLPLDYLVAVYAAMDAAGDRWILERYQGWDDEELARITDARVDLLRDMLSAENQGWEGAP